MKRISLISFIFCIFLSLSAIATEKTLMVNGVGSVFAKPDSATVKLGVEVLRKTASEAQTANAILMTDIISAITKLDVPREKIQTSSFNIWPETIYDKNNTPKTSGYRCSNQISIILSDTSLVPKVIDTATSNGATNIQGISFTLKKDQDLRRTAMQIAVADAKDKAETIATAAGIKLKGIANLNDGGSNVIQPYANTMMLRDSAGASTPISSADIEVRATISITYNIED